MKATFSRVVVSAIIAATCPAYAQQVEPPLAKLKAAAEAGDAAAQDKLGDAYRSKSDEATAVLWYRKAAKQGVVHSQSQLGQIMIGYAVSPMAKPDVQAQHADEAITCFSKAANQGDRVSQVGLGREYESGRFVKQDFVEAYKWFALAAEGGGPFETKRSEAIAARDGIILKMSQEQIAEGRKRVAAFVPRQITNSELPEPAWVKQIKLQGLSGTADRRLAVINGKTFQKGDRLEVKVGGRAVKIQCFEIGEASATVAIDELPKQYQLKLEAQ